MWEGLKAARDGHMSPIERVLVLGVGSALIGVVSYFGDNTVEPERLRAWEILFLIASMTALGLLSSLGIWLRAPANAIIGTAIFVGAGLLANRPNMLDAAVVASSLLNTFLQGAAIGLIDLPPWRRQWAAAGKIEGHEAVRWASYYGITALTWFCLFFTTAGLCDALVSSILPSPRIATSITMIEIDVAAFVTGALILLSGRQLPTLPRSLRIVEPTLWASLVVIAFILQSEILNVGLASVKGALPPILDQANARVGVQQWQSNPAGALRDRLAEAAMLSAFFAPVSIALFAVWDRARAQGKRSLAVSTVVFILVLALSSFLGIAIGTLIETANGGEAIFYGNRIGLPVGFMTGLVGVLLWLRWTQNPEVSPPPDMSAVADVPEHIAKAVEASREAMS